MAPTIPSGVTNMYGIFYSCPWLKGQTITIPTSVTKLSGEKGTWYNGPSWIKQ